MKLKTKISCIFLLFFASFLYGQMHDYGYTQKLTGVSDQWHKIVVPENVFGKVSHNLSDIRIYGVSGDNDTLETPYVLRTIKDKVSTIKVDMKTLNSSSNDNGYYYTFEVPTEEAINQIDLDFKQRNFIWYVQLEGSQDQLEWYSISDNSKILSIHDDLMNYEYSKLNFPSAKFRYFRLLIKTKEKPELVSASLSEQNITKGKYKTCAIKKTSRTENKKNKKNKKTVLDIELEMPVPLSRLDVGVLADMDFYRPITFQYLVDSVQTVKGWKYNYRTLTSGIISSLSSNEFDIESRTIQKLKIIISNHDNPPLDGFALAFSSLVYELEARFDVPADYYLTYGNKSAGFPNYDIVRFKDNIPDNLSVLQLGPVVKSEAIILIENDLKNKVEPLFQNKNWLWGIMTIMILLLGFFTLYMIRNKKE